MTLNQSGISLIHHFESCKQSIGGGKYKAYKCPAGKWTIGWGSTFLKNGKRVTEGLIMTQEQVDDLCAYDLNKFSQGVLLLLKGKQLSPHQFGALVSFAYNVGLDLDDDTKAEGLGDSTLLKKVLANPNDPTIRDEFIKWRSKGTSAEKGLLRRRLSEWWYYSTGQVKTSWDAEIKQIMNA
jgi:lysozyme